MQNVDAVLGFDGFDDFIEIPDSPAFSVSAISQVMVSAWSSPDILTFRARKAQSPLIGWARIHAANRNGSCAWITHRPPTIRPERIAFAFMVSVWPAARALGAIFMSRSPPVRGCLSAAQSIARVLVIISSNRKSRD